MNSINKVFQLSQSVKSIKNGIGRESQNIQKSFHISSIIHGESRVYFSKVIIDVDRGWPISFEQFE